MDRIIDLKTVRNFRDFGGYETISGQTIRTGKLFRSAHFSDTDDADLSRIGALGLKLVVDLRHEPERRRQPNRHLADHQMEIYEVRDRADVASQKFAPHEMFLKEKLEAANDAAAYMMKSYTARPHDPVFVESFSKTLKFMARSASPFVIHCAAGKDRTGTLAAIIHKTLGVSDQDVMSDYMLTMQAVDVDSFLAPAAKFMSERFKRDYDPEWLRPMFGVEPAYLEASLQAIGDFDNYLNQVLEISDQEKAAIQAFYLA